MLKKIILILVAFSLFGCGDDSASKREEGNRILLGDGKTNPFADQPSNNAKENRGEK